MAFVKCVVLQGKFNGRSKGVTCFAFPKRMSRCVPQCGHRSSVCPLDTLDAELEANWVV